MATIGEQIGGAAAGQGIGAALGIGTAVAGNALGAAQSKKLLNQQVSAQKELTDYNQSKALEMWNDTNYEAQLKHMTAAGLSPGLMYGNGGGGGATASVAPGSAKAGEETPSGGNQIMGGMALMLNSIEQLASAANKNADTDNKIVTKPNIEADTVNKVATTPLINSQTEKTQADTYNTEADTHNKGLQSEQIIADTVVKKLQAEQMPQELQLKAKGVMQEGQKIAIMAKEATTHRMQMEVYQKIEDLRRHLALTMQGAELQQKNRETMQNASQFNQGLDQRKTEFWTNTVMRGVEDIVGAAVPWYQQSESVNTTSYDKNGEYNGETNTIKKKY